VLLKAVDERLRLTEMVAGGLTDGRQAGKVADLVRQRYAIYRQRGDVENRHKELKDSLGSGRTSCPRFRITRSARRIVLHLPRACPWLEPWRQVARAVGARAGEPRRRRPGPRAPPREWSHRTGGVRAAVGRRSVPNRISPRRPS
jgi:hypothetical protein